LKPLQSVDIATDIHCIKAKHWHDHDDVSAEEETVYTLSTATETPSGADSDTGPGADVDGPYDFSITMGGVSVACFSTAFVASWSSSAVLLINLSTRNSWRCS